MLFCKLFLALYEYDDEVLDQDVDDTEATAGSDESMPSTAKVAEILRQLGYSTSQTHRAPDRDVQFFEHLFRDATVSDAVQVLFLSLP